MAWKPRALVGWRPRCAATRCTPRRIKPWPTITNAPAQPGPQPSIANWPRKRAAVDRRGGRIVRTRRRWFLAFAGFALVSGLSAGAVWHYRVNRPEHRLQQGREALRRHDWDA